MVNSEDLDLARRANELYDTRVKLEVESHHRGEFVAIEPESGTYYLGRTLDEAIEKARIAYPNCIPYVKRVGFRAAVEIGNHI